MRNSHNRHTKEKNDRKNAIGPLIPLLMMSILLMAALQTPYAQTWGTATASAHSGKKHMPVAELFVYIGCQYCPYAEAGMYRLASERDDFFFLEYHIWNDQAGWSSNQTNALAAAYGVQGTPFVAVDGVIPISGADPSNYGFGMFEESCHDAYKNAVEQRLSKSSLYSITVSVKKTGDNITATATIEINDPDFAEKNPYARFILFERGASFGGEKYRNVVRDLPQATPILEPGRTHVTKNFTVPPETQDPKMLGVAVMIQNWYTGEIMESNYVYLNPAVKTSGDFGNSPPVPLLAVASTGAGAAIVIGVFLWKKGRTGR